MSRPFGFHVAALAFRSFVPVLRIRLRSPHLLLSLIPLSLEPLLVPSLLSFFLPIFEVPLRIPSTTTGAFVWLPDFSMLCDSSLSHPGPDVHIIQLSGNHTCQTVAGMWENRWHNLSGRGVIDLHRTLHSILDMYLYRFEKAEGCACEVVEMLHSIRASGDWHISVSLDLVCLPHPYDITLFAGANMPGQATHWDGYCDVE